MAQARKRKPKTAIAGLRRATHAEAALREPSERLDLVMRAINEGISVNGRPSQSFSKPRNCVTWKRASETSP